MKKAAKGRLTEANVFNLCVRASLVKCFEFNLLVNKRNYPSDAFFWLPALRGTCEDLIVLNFLKSVPPKERARFAVLLMSHELKSKITSQAKFFSAIRPQQPVLSVK